MYFRNNKNLPLTWVGTSSRYFNSLPHNPDGNDPNREAHDKKKWEKQEIIVQRAFFPLPTIETFQLLS